MLKLFIIEIISTLFYFIFSSNKFYISYNNYFYKLKSSWSFINKQYTITILTYNILFFP
jgi:hypothetical protein